MNNTEHITRNAEQGINSTAQRVDSAVKSTAESAKQIVNHASGIAEELANSASSMMENAQASAGDALNRAKDISKRRMDEVEREVKDSPFVAVGIAFLSGVVLTALLKRS